jgi:Fe2+ or Zn2+ uptake regulation protein
MDDLTMSITDDDGNEQEITRAPSGKIHLLETQEQYAVYSANDSDKIALCAECGEFERESSSGNWIMIADVNPEKPEEIKGSSLVYQCSACSDYAPVGDQDEKEK